MNRLKCFSHDDIEKFKTEMAKRSTDQKELPELPLCGDADADAKVKPLAEDSVPKDKSVKSETESPPDCAAKKVEPVPAELVNGDSQHEQEVVLSEVTVTEGR